MNGGKQELSRDQLLTNLSLVWRIIIKSMNYLQKCVMKVFERMQRLCFKTPLCQCKSRPSSDIFGFQHEGEVVEEEEEEGGDKGLESTCLSVRSRFTAISYLLSLVK